MTIFADKSYPISHMQEAQQALSNVLDIGRTLVKADAGTSAADAEAENFEEKAADAEDFEGGVHTYKKNSCSLGWWRIIQYFQYNIDIMTGYIECGFDIKKNSCSLGWWRIIPYFQYNIEKTLKVGLI